MSKRFVPLTFDLIEEGRLKKSLEKALAEASGRLVAYVHEYGPDTASKTKAEVTCKVTLAFEGNDDNPSDFSVKGAITTKLPGPPVRTSRVIQDCEQTGEMTLFVRVSGSDGETPHQGKMFTHDGRKAAANDAE